MGIQYGYKQNQPDMMTITVIVIMLIVALIQVIGDAIARAVDHR